VRPTARVVRLFFDRAREFTGFPPPGLQRLIAKTEYGSASLVGYALNCFDDICPSCPGMLWGMPSPMELLARASLTG
jgi:hypothetical protein